MAHTKVAVVDGANVAYMETSHKGQPKVSNLIAVRKALQERGYESIIIVDASLQYKVDDPQQLEGLLDDQTVRQAPAETDADYFVLKTAENSDGLIISNDQFEPFREEYPWIEERRVPLMIVNGHVEFYGPKMDQ
jgi:hypothetical protein